MPHWEDYEWLKSKMPENYQKCYERIDKTLEEIAYAMADLLCATPENHCVSAKTPEEGVIMGMMSSARTILFDVQKYIQHHVWDFWDFETRVEYAKRFGEKVS